MSTLIASKPRIIGSTRAGDYIIAVRPTLYQKIRWTQGQKVDDGVDPVMQYRKSKVWKKQLQEFLSNREDYSYLATT